MGPNTGGALLRFGRDLRIVAPGVGLFVFIGAMVALPGAISAMTAIGAFAGLAGGLFYAAARFGVQRPFGAANTITTVRLGLLALMIGVLADAGTALQSWWPAALAGLALLLDGIDGAVARHMREESRFGALFDQETDALLILILAAILPLAGKIGFWIVAAGLMRYLLLAAGRIWPALAAPLPKSRFRSVVCGVMVGALVICLLPPVTPPMAGLIAAIALTALTLSFGKDLIWLLKAAGGRKHA